MGQLNYREVTGFFTARIPDSGDADLNPDTVPLTGNVAFHPEYRKPLVFPGEHIVLEPINAIIIDGQLMVEVIQGEDVVLQALHLPVTMDERANQTWSWTMRFHGMTLGQYGEEVSLPDRRFPIEEGSGPLDLSEVAGQWSGGGLITRGPRGYGVTSISADDGVVTVEWEGGAGVEIPIPTAALATPTSDGLMPATDKAKLDGISVEASVGTRVFVGGITVFSDTGRRDIRDSGINPDTVSPAGVAWIVRQGREVTMSLYDVTLTSSGTVRVTLTLNHGFRPVSREGYSVSIASDTTVEAIVMSTGLYLYGVPSGSGYRIRATFKWITDNPWPTTLPGTPA